MRGHDLILLPQASSPWSRSAAAGRQPGAEGDQDQSRDGAGGKPLAEPSDGGLRLENDLDSASRLVNPGPDGQGKHDHPGRRGGRMEIA
jgi:hypothetical protein